MITAVHTLVYSDDAAATRAFFRDVLRWPWVVDPGSSGDQAGADAAEQWLIFASGPSELGVHPTSGPVEEGSWTTPRHHSISLVCDDLVATMAELAERGAQFASEPRDEGFGTGVSLRVPGADDMLLYQPHHPTAYDRS